MRVVDPSQDPSAVPVFGLQHWAESFWPDPNPQNQLPELTTGKERCVHVNEGCARKKKVQNIKEQYFFIFYQSSMSVACASGGVPAGGRLLLLRWLVVVGVSEDQTLRGRGGSWFSSSTYRLLQQRGEVQTNRNRNFSLIVLPNLQYMHLQYVKHTTQV